MVRERGTLIVMSAPSGTGKSTLAKRLLEGLSDIEFSVSYTTRDRRPGELDGREYHFVDDVRFDATIRSDGFLEWAHVHGRRYGTSRADAERVLDAGRDLLLDIDVQGAAQVAGSGIDAVSVFLLPPDYPTLESRLRLRGSDPDEAIEKRLALARSEAAEFSKYDYVVINDDLDRAATELRAIIRAERARTGRRRARVESILETFPAAPGGGTGAKHVQTS